MATPMSLSSSISGHATPERSHQRQATTRRKAAQRKVYGKRRVDAPRAVFEQRSPVKVAEVTVTPVAAVEAVLADVQEKLGKIKIEDEIREEEATATAAAPEEGQQRDLQVKMESLELEEVEAEEEPTEEVPVKPKEVGQPVEQQAEEHVKQEVEDRSRTEKSPKHYETMVEVRICQNTSTGETQPCERPEEPNSDTPKNEEEPWKPQSSETPGEKRSEEATEMKSAKRQARTKKPVSRLSSGCIQDGKTSAYVHPILNEALSPVASQGVQKFSSWAARAGNMFDVVKLAEGSYGEVYKLRLREEICRREMSKSKVAKLREYGDGVFKIVPLRAKSGPGSKRFTSIEEIVLEVKMLKYLDAIPGFARFREIHVVQGRFPESFQSAWMHYKKTKDDCMNPNPSSKRAYPDTQLWAILEMDDAGCELEKFSWSSVFQIYDIFWGVAMALARAEEYALFEHRDLHLGNVCIRSTRPDGCMDPPSDLEVARFKSSSGFGLSTLETTIIDYSLSRAELQLSEDPSAPLEVASSDLDKKEIFDAIGRDEDEILLRNTYRYMRATLYNGNPLQIEKTPDIPGIWSAYAPRTNLVWLLFLLKNLLKNRKPEIPQEQPQSQRKPLGPRSLNKKVEKQTPRGTKGAKQDVSKAVVEQQQQQQQQQHLSKEVQLQVNLLKKVLEDRLEAVLELLDLEHGHEDMCCAADLVAYAIDSQWLNEDDFF